jgi:hypothetical protein
MSPLFVKKHLTTIVLSVLAAISVVWAVVDAGSVTTGESERRKKNLFPAWRHDDVVRIVVALPTESYELVRKGKQGEGRTWDLNQDGVSFPADEQVVDRLLGTLEYATFSREVPAGSVDRAELGLDSPRARYEIGMGSLEFKLVVGKANPGGDGAYVEVPGRGVFVVAAATIRALEVPARDLRGRDFIPYFSTDLASLTLEGEGGTRTFERAPWTGGRGSGFRFPKSAEGRAGRRVDATRLDQVFVSFGRMQAQVFLELADAKAALKPRVKITMTPKDGAKGVLELGGECPGNKGLVVAVRSEPSPLAVCVPEGVLAPLVRPIEEFDDDGLLGATPDEISEVHIEHGGKVLDLARVDMAFRMRQPETRDVSAEVGNSFLEQLADARGVLSKADLPFGEGEITKVRVISVAGAPDKEGKIAERIEEIEIGPGADGAFVALRKEDGTKVAIGEVAASAFRPSDLALRDTDLFAFSAEVIQGMTIQAGGKKQHFEREGATFSLTEPKGKGLRADGPFVQDALAAFANLRAERWAASKPEESFGLSEPRMRIVAHLAEGASKDPKANDVTIVVGARTDDGAYAQIEGKDDVFILPRRFEEEMGRLFVSRADFFIPPEVMGGLTIERGDKKLVLVRDGKQLRLKGGGGSNREAAVIDALSKLTPVVAVAVGEPLPTHGLTPPTLKLKITFRRAPDDPPDAETSTVIEIGSQDVVDGMPTFYGRREGVEAVYAIPERPVKTLLDALGG